MTKKIVLQSIDSPRRELEWKLFMSKKMSDIGFDSVIGSKTQIKLIHETSRNCVFLGRLDSVTGRARPDIDYLASMKKNNTKMFYLHDEGGFYFKSEYADAVKKIYPENIFGLNEVEKVFFWGRKQVEVFKDSTEKEKLLVAGSPRFDLLKEEYSAVDREAIERIKQQYGDYILVCTRFGAVNRVPDEPTTLSQRSLDIRVEGGQKRDQALDAMFKVWEKISYEFSFFVPAVARLVQQFPDINFVIRPHPAERTSFYTESFSHFENVFVDKSGDVRPYIKASKLVIQSECTTGVEAEVAMIPHINFRPAMNVNGFDGWDVAGVSDVGRLVTNYSELLAAVSMYVLNGFVAEEADADVSDYLANVNEDVKSSDLIIDELILFSKLNKDVSKVNDYFSFNGMQFKFFVMGLKEKLRKYKRIFLQKKIIAQGDTKYFEYSREDVFGIWESLGGDSNLIKVKSGVVYVFSKNSGEVCGQD